MKPDFEIRKDKKGEVDEIVADDVQFFHIERMDRDHWWIGITLQDGSRITMNLSASMGARIKCSAEVEEA